jgi:putative lysine/arginine/ornithine/histidine/octopine transport system permease protein
MLNVELMWESLPDLLGGLVLTLELTVLSLIFGMVLALPLAALRTARNPMLWMPVYGYITFFRGTPLLVQIFLIYYGTGQFDWIRETPLWPLLREAYWCAILAFSLNTAAYTAEILRGAIQAVPRGEVEAALALGMSRWLVLRLISLPRAFRLALPAYGNEIILVIKSSSLASTITLLDITGAARTLVAHTYAPYEVFLVAGALYLVLVLATTRLLAAVERWLRVDTEATPMAKDLPQPIG